jgi:uncharacterized membrane protein YdfJ with MMPL/SSD domain
MRRPHRAALFAGVVLVLAVVAALLPDRLNVAGFATPGSESTRTLEHLHGTLGYDPEPGMVVLAEPRGPGALVTDPRGRSAIRAVARQMRSDPDVGRVVTPSDPGGGGALLAKDRRSALILVHFREIEERDSAAPIDRLRDDLRSDALHLKYGGFDVGFLDDNRVVEEDIIRTQFVAIPLLALVLFFVFRGVRAGLLPLAIGAVAEAGTFAGLALGAQVVDVSVYALHLSAVLGLGLAVDYGLFIVTRYREEVAAGRGEREAVEETMRTAGRAVLFSGLTVHLLDGHWRRAHVALGRGRGRGVLPPLLPRAGRLRKPAPADASGGAWYRWSAWVMRRAVPVALVSAAAIVAAGIPATGARWTFLDRQALPQELESREVAEAIASDFEPNLDFPIAIAVDRSVASDPARLRALQREIARLPSAGLVGDPVRARDGGAMIPLVSRAPPLSDESQRLVEDLRALDQPIGVGARIADFVDLKESIRDEAPFALGLVALASLVVLFLLTRSVVLPVKSLLMNVLTIAAVFGVLVAIFQHGLFGIADLIGFDGPAAIEVSIAVVIVGVTLGLATDYSVLLLSRVKEEHDAGAPNEVAVATGLERSGRVITNASVLLALALLAAAPSRVFLLQEFVVGVSIGVLIDATIVRACLMPALMRILGSLNWWAPRILRGGVGPAPTGSPAVQPDRSR